MKVVGITEQSIEEKYFYSTEFKVISTINIKYLHLGFVSIPKNLIFYKIPRLKQDTYKFVALPTQVHIMAPTREQARIRGAYKLIIDRPARLA